MTIIYSFDCAIKNLGFCCIKLSDTYKEEIDILIEEIQQFYDNIPKTKKETLEKILYILSKANKIMDSIFEIQYINVFDLIPDNKVAQVKFTEILKRLKYVIFCLTKQLPKPDYVLIENQMSVNDKARGISRYIEEYFVPLGCDDNTLITYALCKYPLISAELPKNIDATKVCIVAPGLKNAFQIDHVDGSYGKFTEKYATNYSANKAHTTHNFKHWLKITGQMNIIENCPNKLDDLSDAFMMAYAWCKNRGLI